MSYRIAGAAALSLSFLSPSVGAQSFIRGDAICSLGFLFAREQVPCHDALDSNDDGALDIGDPIYLLTYMFGGGSPPPPPFGGTCGPEPTLDSPCDELFTKRPRARRNDSCGESAGGAV